MTAAVVLAAGSSTRMGAPKAHLELPSGQSFLESILATLTRLDVGIVRVVVPPGGGDAPGDLYAVNPDPSRGMLSSIRCGLAALPPEADAVLIWPVDHPRVGAGTVAALVAAYRAHGAPVVVPVHGGRRGHPVLFAGPALAALPSASDEEGARAVVHAHAERIELPVDDPAVLDDFDTPEALAKALGRPGKPS